MEQWNWKNTMFFLIRGLVSCFGCDVRKLIITSVSKRCFFPTTFQIRYYGVIDFISCRTKITSWCIRQKFVITASISNLIITVCNVKLINSRFLTIESTRLIMAICARKFSNLNWFEKIWLQKTWYWSPTNFSISIWDLTNFSINTSEREKWRENWSYFLFIN